MRRVIRWEHEKKNGGGKSHPQLRGGWYDSLLLFGGALFCLASAYRQMYELLDGMNGVVLPKHAWIYVLAVAAVLSVCCGCGVLNRIWVRFLPLLLMALVFGRYYAGHRLQTEDGILYILRMYVVKIANYYNRSMLFPSGIREEAPAAFLFWLCVCFFGLFAFGAVLRRMGMLMLLPLAILIAGLAVGKAPGWESVLLMFAGALVLRMYRVSVSERVGVRAAQLAGMLCLCLAVGAVCSVFTGGVVAKHDEMMKRQLALEDAVLALPVWNLLARDGEVTNDRPFGNGAEMLTVTLSDAPTENVYLKDYAADHYEDGRWSIDKNAFAEAAGTQGMTADEAGEWVWNLSNDAIEEMLSAEDVMTNQWHGISNRLGGVRIAAPREFDYMVSCRNFGKAAPLPYTGRLPSGLTMDGDIAAEKPWTQRSYGGSLVLGGRKDYSLADYVTDSYYPKIEMYFMGEAEPADEKKERQWYDNFVWEQCDDANAPEFARQWLDEMLAQIGWPDSRALLEHFRSNMLKQENVNFMRMVYMSLVKEMLSYVGSYSRELDALPAGTDPVDYFLNVSGEGYCVHFASAGTLLLQAIGIPARYASGYVVFPDDFEKTQDGYTAVVTDARAHAWTEIYLDGFGWMPCEMTPGFADGSASGIQSSVGQAAGDSVQPEKPDTADDDAEDLPEDEKEEEPDRTEDVSDSETGRFKGLWGTASSEWMIFWCGYLLIGLMAVYFAICLSADGIRSHRSRQERRIRQKIDDGHYRAAILSMNRRMYRILSVREFSRGRRIHDDSGYRRALGRLAERRGAEVDADLYMKLLRQAYFSEDEMCAEDANFIYEIYDTLKGRVL